VDNGQKKADRFLKIASYPKEEELSGDLADGRVPSVKVSATAEFI